MPRPKRSKVAPSAPITFPHLAKPAVASAAQKRKDMFSPASSGRVTTTSDDSDGLVVSKKTGARGRGMKAQEYTMSGALAPEDIGPARLKPPSNQTRAALSKIAREADYTRTVAESKASKGAESQMEPDQIPSSIPTEPVPASKPSLVSMGNSSAITSAQMGLGSRIGEMPGPQPSMLGATFKKRARQPSLLQMLQTQNDPTDDLDEDELDDFRPDDESTPMIKSMLQSNAQHTSSSSHQTSGSRKRKLATPEIQVPASQSFDLPSSPPVPPEEQEDLYDPPAEDEARPEPTLPRPRPTQTPQRQIDSDTLAPPQSSSPEKTKTRKTRSKPAKAPTRPQQPKRKQLSPAPSPLSAASTSISPVKPIPLKPLTTATLQNLLPRRRARPRARGEFDIPSSSDVELDNTGLGEDEDELSFHATTKMRRKKAGTIVQKRGGKAKAAPGKRASKTYTKKTTVESDNENDDEDDEEDNENENGVAGRGRKKTPALDGKAKDEMKRLADKFREVDEYTLDFEDMTANSSSQMKDAR